VLHARSSRVSDFSAEWTLRSLSDADALGARIAAAISAGDVVALSGDLGAGKTTLARAILSALGVREAVTSPTFTLVQRYELPSFPVSHFDLYRIEQDAEMEELGLDEALSDGAALIEWPERAGSRLPSDALHVQLALFEGGLRRAQLRGPARWAVLAEGGH